MKRLFLALAVLIAGVSIVYPALPVKVYAQEEAIDQAALGANILPNPSFQDRKLIFAGQDPNGFDVWEPTGWRETIEAPLFSEYVQNQEAHSGGRAVSVGIFTKENSCKLVSGVWETTEKIKIDKSKTYAGSFWAKYEPSGSSEAARVAMDVLVFNAQGQLIKKITVGPVAKSVGTWERYSFKVGPGAVSSRQFPSGAYSIQVQLNARGTDTAPCTQKSFKQYKGKVYFDDVALRQIV